MILLIAFAFLAGIVTVLSPCILPLLPIILASADADNKQRPLGVVVGFIASFTFFTLFLSTIVTFLGISASSLRFISIFILATFGLSLLIPKVQALLEILFSKLASSTPTAERKTGFGGGFVVGLSLGLLWTPCVGPILASVISLALTGSVNTQAFLITLFYALGTALPMLLIMKVGVTALQRVPWLVKNTGNIQKLFGMLMILTAIAIYFNVDRQFQSYILEKFPNYGVGLTKFEDNEQVKQELEQINSRSLDDFEKGQPMSDVMKKINSAPELVAGGEWFNSEPLTLADLKGKVILVDFWTYSCINCQRTFPYLRNWWTKYQDQGLVIIGVHSPEFAFEKEPANLQQAIDDFGLEYPIMQDNNFSTWRAYKNRYWPAKYLVDKDGVIRYTHFGEGDYDETEQIIQDLLKETGVEVSVNIDNPDYQTYSKTPELYLGSDRISNLVSPQSFEPGEPTVFTVPGLLPTNGFAYEGSWVVNGEFAYPTVGSKLYLNFEAREVFLVARPTDEKAGEMKVYLDDAIAGMGEDNDNGIVEVKKNTLYKLIKLDEPGRHELRIEFDGNVEIYAFTFG
ncbi:MAG: cytochrome c biogenesis protein DipZ [Patescibacteria group bacterium]